MSTIFSKKKALLIVGPPGAGKTKLAKALVHRNEKRRLFDDINDVSIIEGDDIILTSPYFCFPEVRVSAKRKLEEMGYEVSFIFFENNLDKCRSNIKLRSDGRKIQPDLFCKGYEIPPSWAKNPLKIWDGANTIVFERMIAGQIIKDKMNLDEMSQFIAENGFKSTHKITKLKSIGRPCPNFEGFTRPQFKDGSLIYRHKHVSTEIKKQKKKSYMREYMRGYNHRTTGNWRTILKLNNASDYSHE